jgi:MFS family permease
MNPATNPNKINSKAWLLIVVTSLGYFVDIYDLTLFNVVKIESLTYISNRNGLGWDAAKIKDTGVYLFNMQMLGMLLGGLLWGILGDKRGRKNVLFGTILLYSVANIVNAFTYDLTTYTIIRIVAGIGLAGELGAAITLVSESLPREKRGYGTMVIVTFGALGAVFGGLFFTYGRPATEAIASALHFPLQHWQMLYIIGGVMGLLLLLLRAGTLESGMYHEMKDKQVQKGNVLLLFKDRRTFLTYLSCILVGVPIWYMIGGLVALSQEVYSAEFGLVDAAGKPLVVNGKAVMWTYIGLSVGDLFCGLLSQLLRSRKKAVLIYLAMSAGLTTYFLFFGKGISLTGYYLLCFLMGMATGYWAIFVTIASEQFGTNIRSTVTNTVPNFVRGLTIPVTMGIGALAGTKADPFLGYIYAPAIVGLVVMGLAVVATLYLKDTFSKDLNYFE